METYIAMIAIILPGFITKTLVDRLNTESKNENETIFIAESLAYSLIVLSIIALELWLYKFISPSFEFNDIVIFSKNFVRISFLIKYGFLALVSCLLSALLIDWIYPKIERSINWIRKAGNKNKLKKGPIWSSAFDDNRQHAVRIEIENNLIAEGFIKSVSGAYSDRAEMYVEKSEEFNKYKDKLFKKIKGVYVDFDKKIIITEYDTDLFYSVMKKIGADDQKNS